MAEGSLTSDLEVTESKRGSTKMPAFGSNEYDRGIDTRTKTSDKLVLAGSAVALAAATGIVSGAFEKGAQEVGDFTQAVARNVEDTYNTLKMPLDGALDLAGKLIPDNEPDKARIPNYILKGQVEIQTSDALRLRQNPNTTGKMDTPNELDWDKVELANKTIVDGKVVYEPIDVNEGDRLVVTNPELVVGQYTGGGSGNNRTPEEKLWLQLYTTDGGSVFVNYQGQTREFVHELKADPTTPSTYIKAETLQNSHGVTLVRYNQAPPQQTSSITNTNLNPGK